MTIWFYFKSGEVRSFDRQCMDSREDLDALYKKVTKIMERRSPSRVETIWVNTQDKEYYIVLNQVELIQISKREKCE